MILKGLVRGLNEFKIGGQADTLSIQTAVKYHHLSVGWKTHKE